MSWENIHWNEWDFANFIIINQIFGSVIPLTELGAKIKIAAFESSHLGDSGRMNHRTMKGAADSPMQSSRVFILGIPQASSPSEM